MTNTFSSNLVRSTIAAVIAGAVLSLLAIYPQWNLSKQRGDEFNGIFATCDLDETAYAAYLQAVIDGRPRRNDPYTGRDDSPDSPQPESLFSIQFATTYAAAYFARIAGLSASDAMPFISIFSAFFSGIALFWLFYIVSKNNALSLAGTIAVMTGSAAISGIGALNSFYEGGLAYPFFPYLRRHIPSMSFPFLFVFLGSVWHGIQAPELRKQVFWSVLAAACFAVLVFSYFYLWTSAAAVVALIFVFSIPGKPLWENTELRFLLLLGGQCVLVLVPYIFLVSGRSPMMDKAQLLVLTREPDLLRNIELIGIGVILLVFLLRRWLDLDRRLLVLICALAASPITVFNQQIITGRSLQPFHYEYYSINYVAALAVAIAAALIIQRALPAKALTSAGLMLAATFSVWGVFEAVETTRIWDQINAVRDESVPVNLRLRELAGGSVDPARYRTTFNSEPIQADSQPVSSPHPVLWARHQHTFAGITDWQENKDRYYKQLYFSNRGPEWLRDALSGCSDLEACMALFGWDRFNATLSTAARPLTYGEIVEEAENFKRFIAKFDAHQAYDPLLHYAVRRADDDRKFEDLYKWYEPGEPEALGKYVLIPLKPRPQK